MESLEFVYFGKIFLYTRLDVIRYWKFWGTKKKMFAFVFSKKRQNWVWFKDTMVIGMKKSQIHTIKTWKQLKKNKYQF